MKICSFLGVKIYLNKFFLLLLVLFFVAGILEKGLIVFGTVFVHEMAHVLIARRLGVYANEVELLPFGGVARVGGDLAFEPVKEFYVAIAGPACNIVLIILGITAANFGLWHERFSPFFLQCNVFLALFNLLPALPLDGGRVLRAFLAHFYGLKTATHIAAISGQIIASLLILGGIAGFFLHITGLDVFVVALFLLYAATKEKSMAPYHFIRHMLQKKKELLQKGVVPAKTFAARDNLALQDVMKLFVPGKYHFIMLIDGNNSFMGIMGENDIVEGVLEKGVNASLGSVFLSE